MNSSDKLRSRAARLIEEALGLSAADQARVAVSLVDTAQLRFARNTVTTSALVDELRVSVRSHFGRQSAEASGNPAGKQGLRALVRRSEEMARLMPEDPEAMPEPGSSIVPVAPAPELDTEAERSRLLAAGSRLCIERAKGAGLIAAGFSEVKNGIHALGTSAGFAAFHTLAEAHASSTFRTPDGSGSGWGSHAALNAAGLDYDAISESAMQKARGSARPSFLAPGELPAILEPACVAQLLRLLVGGMDARALDEGRSAFSTEQLDGRLFPSLLNVSSNPLDPSLPAQPWSPTGQIHGQQDWIRGGALAAFHTNPYWAKKSGREPLAPPPNLLMQGGQKNLAELIASTERALLVTSLWYLRQVDPRSMLYTGLTRDGVFLIEDGQLVRPVNNFRWNDSPLRLFQALEELSRSTRVGGRGGASKHCQVPAMKVHSFRLTSVSEAV